MAEAAVLLPVRLETRFDEPDGFTGTRLRVLVVPDVCWYDRHQPPSRAEIDLLEQAVGDAGGPLVTGAPSTPEAAAAFDALAAKVGPGRALWLARTSPAEAGREGAQGTWIRSLPQRLSKLPGALVRERRVTLTAPSAPPYHQGSRREARPHQE